MDPALCTINLGRCRNDIVTKLCDFERHVLESITRKVKIADMIVKFDNGHLNWMNQFEAEPNYHCAHGLSGLVSILHIQTESTKCIRVATKNFKNLRSV